jgi:hypothetical protein
LALGSVEPVAGEGADVGARELVYPLVAGLAGLAVAALVILMPWYGSPDRPGSSVVQLVAPGGVAGQP